jgi:hypothetical protein
MNAVFMLKNATKETMMQIVKVEIRKHGSYEDYPNQIAGIVQLQSDQGKQEVKLSASVVSAIFAVLKNDLIANSKALADQVESAANHAVHAPLLEDQSVIAESF